MSIEMACFKLWELTISRENLLKKLEGKIRENIGVLYFLTVDNFDFTRKIVEKNSGEKLVKMLGVLHF